MAYTAKYASAFYGPFREALASAPKPGALPPSNVTKQTCLKIMDKPYNQGLFVSWSLQSPAGNTVQYHHIDICLHSQFSVLGTLQEQHCAYQTVGLLLHLQLFWLPPCSMLFKLDCRRFSMQDMC